MSLKGVCLDGGPVPYLILPYMANGSLASYLKKERKNLVIMIDDDNASNDSGDHMQSQVSMHKYLVIPAFTNRKPASIQ